MTVGELIGLLNGFVQANPSCLNAQILIGGVQTGMQLVQAQGCVGLLLNNEGIIVISDMTEEQATDLASMVADMMGSDINIH